MTSTSATEMSNPQWRTGYGPHQLRDVLGLFEWQYLRARESGTIPVPDSAGGKWSRQLVKELYARRVGIRRSAGTVPDLGARSAAGILADRLGIDVLTHAVHELAWQGLLLVVGEYRDKPLYCGRTLETWTAVGEVETANVVGERLVADDAAGRLGVRRTDFDHLVRLGWIVAVAWGRGPFTANRGTPDVPLYRAGDLTALLSEPGIDWDAVRAVHKGGKSPLAGLLARTP
jgi:hypothetical protein